MDREKEIIIIVIVLVVIVAGAFYFFGGYFDGKVGDGENEPVGVEFEDGSFEELNAADVQENFPSDFPFEEGAGITNNYKYNLRNSLNDQYTMEYESSRSLEENFSVFEEYFNNNGYKIANSMNNGNTAFLYGDGKGGDISVLIEEKRGVVVISASFLRQ